MTKLRRCPVCGSPVKPENLSRHLKKVHPDEDAENHVSKKKTRKRATRREGVVIAGIAIVIVAIVIVAFTFAGQRESLEGKPAPAFSIVDVKTQTSYSMPANYRGELVFLELFRPTCHWCIEFIPTMQQLYNNYHLEPVNFISIDVDPNNDTQDLLEFLAAHPESKWPHSLDVSNAAEHYKMKGTPHLFIIDLRTDPSEAIVEYDHPGIDTYSSIASELDRLLGP